MTEPKKPNNTFRNIALGCLGFVVVAMLVGGFLAYRFVVRPVQNAVQSVERFGEIGELNERISNRSNYAIPADGILTEAQLERFLNVQSGIRERMEGEFSQLQEKYQDLENQDVNLNNIRQVFSSYTDLFDLIRTAKEAQVEQLNNHDFSLEEYSWVRQEAIRAAGLIYSQFDLTELTGENVPDIPLSERVPQENIDLLEPYRDQIEEYIGLAFFGL